MNYKGLTRRSFILGLSALGLTGCGWHLRGKQNVPFKTIYIALGENSAVRATIRRNLEAQTEVKVVNDRKEAEAIFELDSPAAPMSWLTTLTAEPVSTVFA
jgi:LPS-assembly lipoprotein